MQLKTTILFLLALFTSSLSAQQVDIKELEGLKIRNIGPAGMSGRVTAIDVDLSNSDRIFAGTASGGVWMSENGGISWKPVFDDEAVINIGSIAINQKNPAEIWVGTGEGNPRNSMNSGAGIYKTIDGGKSWKLMGLENTKTIHRIIIHRDNPDIVFAGSLGSIWGKNTERGVFKTTDGGKTWKKALYINDGTGIADLVVDPTNPNKLVAATWQFGREPWFFNSGGNGSGIHISYDAGETWKKSTHEDGLPKGDLGRIGLAIAPSQPNIIYALVEAKENGMYKSSDGGTTWKLQATKDIGNRPFYYADIFVDPQNENRIYNLWSSVSKSEDGGKTFENILGWNPYGGVHPDHHAFWVHPNDPSYLIEGNDGGLNISRDRGETWQFVENMPLAQFYHINYDMEIPYNVCGGMQDNGSWIGPSQVWQRGGIKNFHWQEVFFGDGFDVLIRPDDSRYGYAMSQGGNVGYFDKKTGETKYIKPVHPDGLKLRYNWNAGIAQDPYNDCGVYYGSQFLHYSTNCGQSWDIISPDLTTNDTTKQKQAMTGGLTIDNTQAENFTTILSIAPSPIEEGVIWVGTDDGNLQLTRDGGKTWNNLASKLKGARDGSWIAQINASTYNAGEAWIVVNDYRRNDWRPMAYQTTDYGKTFTRIVDENKVKGHVWSIVQDPIVPELLFLGTDFGMYMSIDKGQNWNKWMNDYPSVPTADLKIHPRDGDLIVGTFGRAAWILDNIDPLRELAKTNGQLLNENFKVFASPTAYQAVHKAVNGSRFIADGVFVGDNKSSGGMITFWAKAPKMSNNDEAEAPKIDKATIKIVNSQGDTIRTFKKEIKDGMNRLYWNLRADGFRFPSRTELKEDADLPSGMSVMPGNYQIIVSWKEWSGTTKMRVDYDPRLEVSEAALKASASAYTDFEKLVTTAKDGFDQLTAAQKTIKLVNSQLLNAPDSIQTQIKDEGEALNKRIAEMQELYMLPEGLKGIQRTSENINSYLWTTSRYLRDSNGAPNQMATFMMNKSKKHVTEAIDQINAFFTDDWKEYQDKVEAARASLFEQVEPIKF